MFSLVRETKARPGAGTEPAPEPLAAPASEPARLFVALLKRAAEESKEAETSDSTSAALADALSATLQRGALAVYDSAAEAKAVLDPGTLFSTFA